MKKDRPKAPITCSGYVTFIYNLFVLLIGACIASTALATILFLKNLDFDKFFIKMTWYVFGTGVGVCLVSVFAFVGVCRRVGCCLTLHFFGTCAMMAALVLAGIFALVYSNEYIESIQSALTKIVGAMNKQNVSNTIMLKFQSMLHCCGADSFKDYDAPTLFCCEGTKNCTKYLEEEGCNKVLGKFLDAYEITIGVVMIISGLLMGIPAYLACRTKKNFVASK
ncbi:unnamed protein product [Rodentolepis nana]|uniref:Tetraspanin n=1 Tax=Rodentolepis nana TaxID=102285 RepID=A0A0R3U0G3_RODNA|nr:unnamed protein product [Rodentolepis nana]